MNHDALEQRLAELEIQAAWQDELLQSLSDTVARLQQILDLQQAQLRLLYQKLPEKSQVADMPASTIDETPPHY